MGYGIPDFCLANQILTGIQSYEASSSSILVYPNPFHSNVTILYSSAKEEVVTIELRDVAGRILKSQKQKMIAADGIKLDFLHEKELTNGIYIISILTPESVFYKKIIKE